MTQGPSPYGTLLQGNFTGSVPSGTPTGTVLRIGIVEALERGLKHNLGQIQREEQSTLARAQRYRALSTVLPNISGRAADTLQKVSLAAFGLSLPGVPTTVGPFSVLDARLNGSATLFDASALLALRSARELEHASTLAVRDSRDIIVLIVGQVYLQAVASRARVDTARAQVETSRALHQLAVDRHRAGLSPGIDETRAQVELQMQQLRVVAQQGQYQKDRMALGRVIGLPPGQDVEPADDVPFAPLDTVQLDQALDRAYNNRADYLAAKEQASAAENLVRAARAERLPTLALNADYGYIGRRFNQLDATYTVSGGIRIPIFQGGRVRADVLEAESNSRQRKTELEDLRGRIDYDVRAALLDLRTAAEQVRVARSNVDLANQTLTQSRDRFTAGVADTVEVVQAQESVALANESLISSQYAFNVAKVSLARALGLAEETVRSYFSQGAGAKPGK